MFKYLRGRCIPPAEHGPWTVCDERANRASNVITFEMNFRPSGFDRPVNAAFKEQIRSKLNIAGVVTLVVVFMKDNHGEVVLHFEGPDEEVAKAKAAFDQN